MFCSIRCILCYGWLLFILALFSHMEGSYSRYRERHHDQQLVEYSLYDIGLSRLPCEALSKKAFPLSQAPCINNQAQVIYNDSQGGCLWDCIHGTQRLIYKNVYARFHAINNKGVVLASAINSGGKQTWMLWSEKNGLRQDPYILDCPCPNGACVYFRAINDDGMLVGLLKYDDSSIEEAHAVVWPSNGKLYLLDRGIAWGVSDSGYAVVSDAKSPANSPYLWHKNGGFLVLPEHSAFKKPADVRYVDMQVDYEGGVYGTFFYNNQPNYLHGFYWQPCQERFDQLDLGGMRISAMNSRGILVGSWCGRAVARARDGVPFDLNRLVEIKGKCWHLIEATDINDLGQIVGYAKVDGEYHIFLLQPLPQTTLKVYRRK
jgi:hypothetical protein